MNNTTVDGNKTDKQCITLHINLSKRHKEQLVFSESSITLGLPPIHHILVCMVCSVDTSIISNVLSQCELTIDLLKQLGV